MQEVTYPAMGNIDGAEYVRTAATMLTKILREEPTEKALRRWMRGQGALDKGSYDKLLELLDVRWDKPGSKWHMGGFARTVAETSDLSKRQDLFFERIVMSNEILAKYVFDALQERLYSTNELYRMLTSYVYPGKEIDLPFFLNWLKWVEASGRIRVLGIRWALGTRYDDSAQYIAGIDVDEILEEEAEAELLGETTPEPEPEPEPAPAPAPTPTPTPEPEPEVSVGWEPPEDDEEAFAEPAATPAPAAPATPVAAAAGAQPPAAVDAGSMQALVAALGQLGQGGAGGAQVIEARLLDPAPQLAALAAGEPLERVRAAMDGQPLAPGGGWLESLSFGEAEQSANLQALLEWWSGVAERPITRADQAGLMPYGPNGWGEGSRGKFLFRLAALAVSIFRGRPGVGQAAFGVLDGAGFFATLYDEPGSVERLMDELFEQGLGARAELFEQLHLHLMLARSLRGSEDWCRSLEDLEADALMAALWKRLAAYQLDAEVLWIAREMSMFGLWRQEGLREVRVVPTAEARRCAFHLGFIEGTRADGVPALLALSRRLTPLLQQELEGPLVALWRAYGAHPPRRFRVR